jgi:flagellar motor switch protein FliM
VPPTVSSLRDVDADASSRDRAAADRPASDRVVTTYDFRRPTKLSREHIRMLDIAYEAFARRATTLLTSSLRQVCTVTPTEVVQQSYEEYVTGLPTQTLMATLDIPPLAGTGVFEFSLPTALAAIDHMLGGPGGVQAVRTLTDVELTLVRGLLDQIVSVLSYSFDPVFAMRPSVASIEYNPQFAQAAGATDAVVTGEFEMVIGSETCRATLCLPLASVLPRLAAHRPKSSAENAGPLDREGVVRRLRERLGDVLLDVNVRFKPAALSTHGLLSLAVGDVLPLTHRAGTPLTIEARGITFAHGIPGRAGHRLAALVVNTPQEHL